MDPLQVFDNFKLDTLDEKWSDEVWEREFLSFPEPPADYSIILGSHDMEQFLRETSSTLKQWISQNKDDDELSKERSEVSWQTITALEINIRGLLAVLGYLMKTGQATSADEDDRQACLASTGLYFVLLSVPDSSTFYVFHPNLYHRALETFKLSELLVMCKRTQKTTESGNSSGEQFQDISMGERCSLTEGLNSVMYDLITLLQTFCMKFQLRSLEITVIIVVEVTKLGTEVNHFVANHSKKLATQEASITTLVNNAYVALQSLIEPRHGTEEVTIKMIMKCLMPHLCPHLLDLPTRAANVIWDTTMCFLKTILCTKKNSAKQGMEILIQHLLVNCPDRSEPRQKQAGIIAKLINICQEELYLTCIKNVVLFSFYNKIPFRVFGQEVTSKLLAEMAFNFESEDEVRNRKRAKMALIAVVHSRTIDVSSMVRGKSLSTIESMISCEDFALGDFLNTSEEDQPFPKLDAILAALSGGPNPLPGPNAFMSRLLERMKDERALVRRCTLHVLQYLVPYFPALFDKVAPIIGLHCRDPALSVRREAINALACLLHSNPLNETLLREYIKSVLPRIYDVEVKVQESVLESLQNLVLNEISEFSSTDEGGMNEPGYHLPWNVLRALTQLKMRKNLSKICDSWVKNKVITDSMIGRIQSHLGTLHNEEAWVLLLALADKVALPNMRQYFEDFEEVLAGDEFVNIIKLEVLRLSWQNMDDEYLESFSKRCFDCLCRFGVPIESIGTCIDILDCMEKYLKKKKDGKGDDGDDDDDDDDDILSLMRLSEAQINKLSDEDEEVDDESICTYLKAMNTLGHASLVRSDKVDQSTLDLVQGLLLDCVESIKMSEGQLEKFKAVGIVLLGQQALKNREFAEQVVPILGRLMLQTDSKSGTPESSGRSVIRINAVKTLADLCVRYTALVEPFLPDMCVTMKDTDPMVRETIVVIFVQLLLEEFIKVKGAFFYHILTMLSDSDETIRELTVYLIKERLLAKNKSLVSQSFIKGIFHYNNCKLKHKFYERKIREKERNVLLLPGKKNESRRRIIYDFMLEHLDPPSKLKILMKLNAEIFEGACEKFIDVKQIEGACVVKDVIYIVSNDRMQASSTSFQDDDMHEDVAAAVENQINQAVNVIAEGMKKFKFQIMTQTLMKLRQFLIQNKSPGLLVDVSKLLSKLLSEFNKDQISEILDEYPNLRRDIDRDISMSNDMTDDSDSDSSEEQSSGKKALEITDVSNAEEQLSDDVAKKVSQETVATEPLKTPKATPRKICEVSLTGMPRMVLRRLSALTYPGVQAWKSPSHSTIATISELEPSNKSTLDETNMCVDDLSDSESIQKPNKIARLAESVADVTIS